MKSFEDDQLAKQRTWRPGENRTAAKRDLAAVDSGPGSGHPVGAGHMLALQRSAGNAAVVQLLKDDEPDEAMSTVHEVVGQGRGQALPAAIQTKAEAGFGQSFEQVRLHTDAKAAASAASVQARAYTSGNDIVLGSNAPSLDSAEGENTLLHELAHVRQQQAGPVDGTLAPGGVNISDPSDRFETQAQRMADRIQAGDAESEELGSGVADMGAFSVQRQEEDEEEAEEE
jgi:hypothetical protein